MTVPTRCASATSTLRSGSVTRPRVSRGSSPPARPPNTRIGSSPATGTPVASSPTHRPSSRSRCHPARDAPWSGRSGPGPTSGRATGPGRAAGSTACSRRRTGRRTGSRPSSPMASRPANGPCTSSPAPSPSTATIADARLYATAHGVYEAFVNGTRVGDHELAPGWTAYRTNLHVQTYDVTDLLVVGDNVVGALLSDGWWRGQNSVSRRVDDYGTTTALLAQLVVTLDLGRRPHVRHRRTLARDAEPHPRRRSHRGRGARPAATRRLGPVGHRGPGPRRGPRLRAAHRVAGAAGPPGGGAPAGLGDRARARAGGSSTSARTSAVGSGSRGLGPAGTELTLTYGEWLDEHGDVTQEHVTFPASTDVPRSIDFQVDRVTAAGRRRRRSSRATAPRGSSTCGSRATTAP